MRITAQLAEDDGRPVVSLSVEGPCAPRPVLDGIMAALSTAGCEALKVEGSESEYLDTLVDMGINPENHGYVVPPKQPMPRSATDEEERPHSSHHKSRK